MRRNSLLGVVFAGAFLMSTSAGSGFAQAPGGGGASQQTRPMQSPNSQVPTTPDGQTATSKVDDKQFAMDAAVGGLTEVELGKLALQKSSNDGVKQFAQHMVDDHTKANDQLKQLATHENIEIPAALDSKHQARVDKLGKLSGDQFDRAYVKDQLKDHQSDVRAFSGEAEGGTDPNLKAFASTNLPTLQQHLEMVKSLNKATK